MSSPESITRDAKSLYTEAKALRLQLKHGEIEQGQIITVAKNSIRLYKEAFSHETDDTQRAKIFTSIAAAYRDNIPDPEGTEKAIAYFESAFELEQSKVTAYSIASIYQKDLKPSDQIKEDERETQQQIARNVVKWRKIEFDLSEEFPEKKRFKAAKNENLYQHEHQDPEKAI